MKKTTLLLVLLTVTATLSAQSPSWAKKAAQAVFTLKTFKTDGTLLASSNGFFVSEQGDAVSSFTPFRGAQSAVVIDSQGKEWPVTAIVNANDMYDVAKFQVAVKKASSLHTANTPAGTGATVWLLPYSTEKSPVCQRGTVSSAESFQTVYTYYTLNMQADERHTSCPVLNDNGEVIGLLQSATDGSAATSYAVSARFATSLEASALMMNDPSMQSTAIPKAVPTTYKDALLSLVIAGSTLDNRQYDDYVNRFIQQFPGQSDGYVYRARNRAAVNDFAGADQDMQQAVRVADQKDDVHYQYALLIFQKVLYSDQPYDAWTLDRALEEAQLAYQSNPMPVYRQQQAQILFAQNKYAEAYTIFDELTKGEQHNAETFYAAAQCKLQLQEKKEALMLLDSAVNTFSRPYVKTATPYLIARAELSMDMRRYQQAINDMQDIVTLEPNNAGLWAQKASYELRVNLFDQALESAQQCLRLDPQGSDGYLMSGIAQCAKGDRQQGLPNLQKAKELGNDQAQTFIDKYSK